ncbi:hypothetical protein JMJ56_16590 [Belnapia sp. T18]|uniref:Uncharacterized protein n=1 Tax=Belnapia arida TaxID=2804533 RepID=A0ABS1U4S0_9PROT|nr:hypothetical protein [Belnapia arida]MBL6079638.1 hypothetical protein [Belnapia arida]
MNQNDAITAAQSLTAEAERLQADAQATRGEADALRSAIQGPSEVVQQAIARLEADARAKTERAHSLERAAASLLSGKVGQEGGSAEGFAAFDTFARASLSPLVARLASAVRGQDHTAGQPGPNGPPPINLQGIGKILEDGLHWLAKESRRQGGRP